VVVVLMKERRNVEISRPGEKSPELLARVST
jgi:hypothetical protein